MQQLNLLDPSLLPPLRLLSGARCLVLAAVAVAAVGSHWGFEQSRLTQALRAAGVPVAAQADAAAATAAGASAANDGSLALQAKLSRSEALRALLDHGDSLPPDSAALLRSVIAALPDSAWLTEVDISGARGLRIAGGMVEPGALAAYAQRLAAVAPLRGVPIETLRVDPPPPRTDNTSDNNTDNNTDSKPHNSTEARRPAHHSFVLASANAGPAEAPR